MPDPDLTPAEEQVRRLLADARHAEPLPGDVAERLDRVLADLHDEAPARRTPPPVDLAARRRRRTARTLLVAAAAVVVIGVGISQIDLGGQESADSGSADSSAAESAPQKDAAGGDTGGQLRAGPPVVLRSDGFDRQVRRLQADSDLRALAEAPSPATSTGWCDDPAWGEGERVRVRYDGQRGVLVLRPAVGATQDVDLYLCGASAVTRSVRVPVG